MSQDWKDLMLRIDSLIREGNGQLAKEEILKLNRSKIPRPHLSRMASLANRAHLPLVALRMLKPIVRGHTKKVFEASDLEKIEYAFALIRIGAEVEGLEILSEIDEKENPRVLLFRAGAFTANWAYKEAIPLLREYLKSPLITDYMKSVAEINLVAALIHERQIEEAKSLLTVLVARSKEEGHQLNYAKSLQLSAECAQIKKDWEQMNALLTQVEGIYSKTGGLDELFVKKMRLQADLETAKDPKALIPRVRAFHEEASKRGHFESIRDCDRTLAIVTKDGKLATRVYVGTPYPAFRERFKADFYHPFPIPTHYDWVLNNSKKGSQILDLTKGILGEGKAQLHKEDLLFRILTALSKDFYRPLRLPAVHHVLYPDEFYNASAVAKIHRAMTRLREWLKEMEIPLEISEEGEFYSLASKNGLTVRVFGNAIAENERLSGQLLALQKTFASKPFAISEAIHELQRSRRTVLRALSDGVEEGVLQREGSGSSTRYSFKKSS